jgi:hypothetical protein
MRVRVRYLERGANLMCDYSLHAVASRPAKVGETLVTKTFRGTSTRGFASERDPEVAVCMLPGTELAFERPVKHDNGWIWTRATEFRVGKFGRTEPDVPHQHHDAIEFPDGSSVLVTHLTEGQHATVLQLPASQTSQRSAKSEKPPGENVTAVYRLISQIERSPIQAAGYHVGE